MSLSQQFSQQYEAWYKKLRTDALAAKTLVLRKELLSPDNNIRSRAEEELENLRPPSNDPLGKCIKVFLSFDDYAHSLFNGNQLNQLASKQQHIFLKNKIYEYSNTEVNFPPAPRGRSKPKLITINNHSIEYAIFNAMNNYKSEVQKRYSEGRTIPTIVIFAGMTSEIPIADLKLLNAKNIQVFNIDEFVEWLKQN